MSLMLIKDLCWVATREAGLAAPDRSVRLVSADGTAVRCFSGTEVAVDGAIDPAERPGAVFVAAFWGSAEQAMADDAPVIPWLQACHDGGVPLAASSTGTFFLAEAGLLDGKVATTYPPFVETFRRRYPDVRLRPERAITDAGGLYCANGIPAGCDLIVSVLELLHGPDVARRVAGQFLVGFSRSYAVANIAFDGQKYHHDRQVLTAQQWLERNYAGDVRLTDLAADVGMSGRNFSRRFKAATGDSPQAYLQRIRVEAAKDLLRETNISLSEVAYRVGYADPGSFTHIFRQLTGESPRDFRDGV